MTDQRLTAKGGVHSVVFDANLNQSGALVTLLSPQLIFGGCKVSTVGSGTFMSWVMPGSIG